MIRFSLLIALLSVGLLTTGCNKPDQKQHSGDAVQQQQQQPVQQQSAGDPEQKPVQEK